MFKRKKTIVNNEDKTYDPIVFVNKPVIDLADDVVGFESQIDTIKCSINNGATMIGIVADYGTGKSSITDMLGFLLQKKPFKYPAVIKINMWDCLQKEKKSTIPQTNSTLVAEEISDLTKSFLFQFANGKSSKFASYVNKRLSKNYGTISFSMNTWKFWPWLVGAGVCYAVNQIFTKNNLSFIKYPFDNIETVLKFVQDVSPIFTVLAFVCLIIGVKDTCIAYSHWKMQYKRESEINDVFDIYAAIIKKLDPGKNKKQVIIIEDLDRIVEKTIIIGFLKELYRFQSSLRSNNKKFIFIISIKPEAILEDNGVILKTDDMHIYSKIFDVTFSLKPIHYEDYDALLLKLINNDTMKKQQLENLIKKPLDTTLPDSFEWIKKGTNLTLRDLKDRLNQAISIMVSLKNKQYKVKSSIEFKACAAISYMESQYPKDYYYLIKSEEAFAELINKSYEVKNQKGVNKIKELTQNFNKCFNKSNKENSSTFKYTEGFINDLCQLIVSGVFDDDFRMYFYTYPKGCHIKTTDEKELCNLLLLPTQYHDYSKLDETINRVYKNGENNIITDIINKLVTYPPVVIENDTIMRIACNKSYSNVYQTFENEFLVDLVSDEHCINALSRLHRINFKNKTAFIKSIINGVIDFAKNSEDFIAFRKCVIEAFADDSNLFKELFSNEADDRITQISEEEIGNLDSIITAIELVDQDNLSENEFEYITDLLNRVNLSISNQNSFVKAKDIYDKYLDIITPADISLKLFEFLKTNVYLEDNYFEIITENITDKSALADYLNNFDPSALSEKYIALIDQLGFESGLNDGGLELLSSKGKFYSVLLSKAGKDLLDTIDFADVNISKIILKDCSQVIKSSEITFIKIRKFAYIQKGIDIYKDLYFNNYPLITAQEYRDITTTRQAISMINTAIVDSSNYQDLSNIFTVRKYTAEEIVFLFHYLFDLDTNMQHITSSETISGLVYCLDYDVLNIVTLSINQREKIISLIFEAMNLGHADAALSYMQHIKCLISSLEEVVQESEEYDEEYVELLNSLDQYTDTSIEWLKNNYIHTKLTPKICSMLKECGEYQNYIIGSVLRENNLILDKDIPFTDYVKVYSNVEEIFPIMSNHWSFLEQLQKEKTYEELNIEHIRPIYCVKQHSNFFKYIFDKFEDAEIINYINQFGELASEVDSKAFQMSVCSTKIMKLLGDREIYNKIHFRLWDTNKRHKGVFTQKWNAHWKKAI